jgi:hypothetical protein
MKKPATEDSATLPVVNTGARFPVILALLFLV